MARVPIANSTEVYTPPLKPTRDQAVVLYVIAVYLVIIFACWSMPGARRIINPFKLLTIGWHELCHIIAAVMTGGRVLSVSIDPNLGGMTQVEGGIPLVILSAGYIGSTFFGACLILGGWDILAAKVTSFFIAIGLVCPLILVRDKLTVLLTVGYLALLIGFWFIDHGYALRWYSLFVGVMNIFYAAWDWSDDRFFKKPNDSDATQFTLLFRKTEAHYWAIGWIFFEVVVFVAFILIGLASFKQSPDDMIAEAAAFLPT